MILIVKLHKVNNKKYSLKLVSNMSFVEIQMPIINYRGGGGSKRNDTKGNHLYNYVIENNIVILNDGTGTRLNPINMETSSIDLSLVGTSIGPHCTWYVDQKSTHGSDHFVVNIKISYKPMIYSNQYNSLKWNYKNADWK